MHNVLSMNTKTDTPVVAMLGNKRGLAKVSFVNSNEEVEIECHQAEIRYLALNPEGTLLASASTKGTLIRIFDTVSGNGIKEVRRGSDNADIQCLAFSSMSLYLACTSDRDTAHVFAL